MIYTSGSTGPAEGRGGHPRRAREPGGWRSARLRAGGRATGWRSSRSPAFDAVGCGAGRWRCWPARRWWWSRRSGGWARSWPSCWPRRGVDACDAAGPAGAGHAGREGSVAAGAGAGGRRGGVPAGAGRRGWAAPAGRWSTRTGRPRRRSDATAWRCRPRSPEAADRVAGRQHAGVRAGRVAGAGAGRGGRGAVRGRGGAGARLPGPAGADRGAVRGLPVRAGRGADVPDRGPGPVDPGRAAGVRRAGPTSR